ncbi:hypothetical protein [Gemmatimonas sp.]|uniref:hypothetical protein n=1 Tax=Gemmatimonas sp. TaxID=1962908 RepID=UPI0039833C46
MTPSFSVERSARRWFALFATALLAAACGDPSTATDAAPLGDPVFARQGRTTTSTIQVTVSGLPAGALASIAVTGPNGYARTLTATTTITSLTSLTSGSYSLTAASVISGLCHLAPRPHR